MYADVNQLFGDIVKVTPSSKAVGDMALFLITNNLTVDDVLDTKRELAFPESVVDLMAGRMGQPPGGFPPEVQNGSCAGKSRLTDGPGPSCRRPTLQRGRRARKVDRPRAEPRDVMSYLIYPESLRRLRRTKRSMPT